jgi:hypothetical protein
LRLATEEGLRPRVVQPSSACSGRRQ